MMLVRRATSADAPLIAQVQVEGWRSTYRGIVADEFLDTMSTEAHTRQWLDALDRPEHLTWVVEAKNDGMVAFADGGPERTGRQDFRGELYAIYILHGWRGRGIGKRLVRQAAGALLESDMETMLVWVLADNPHRRFYEALGGRPVDEQEIQIGNQRLVEVAYGWDDLRSIADPPA
jgi:ribosomal protein S18 acetylase RimI-like enzyme